MNTVTYEQIKNIMDNTEFLVETKFGKLCVVTALLPNGFTVVESSGCVDPANYDIEIGKENCMKRIEDKIWMLEGYKLQSELHENQRTF